MAVASWALLAIQEIGHIIEEPFNMPFDSTPQCHRTSLGMEEIAFMEEIVSAVADEVHSAIPKLDVLKPYSPPQKKAKPFDF